MPNSASIFMIDTVNIKDGAVTTAKLANGSVTSPKIVNLNVTAEKLANGSVTWSKISDGSVTTEKLANGSVTSVKLGQASVTTDKIANYAVTSVKFTKTSIVGSQVIPAQSAIVPSEGMWNMGSTSANLKLSLYKDGVWYEMENNSTNQLIRTDGVNQRFVNTGAIGVAVYYQYF